MKKVWVTSTGKDEQSLSKLMSPFKTYGLHATGHF